MTERPAIAEQLAVRIDARRAQALPPRVQARAEEMLIDIAGLCVAARDTDYVRAALDAWEADGGSTVIGHARKLDAAGAAFVNGAAAHGEDFDDTFEGGPVHAVVVIVPAILAASERHRITGADALYGLAIGVETMCRLSLVAPKLIHKAGSHPTAVLGALGAAAGVAASIRLPAPALVSALGIAGSMASGIIEYLAEGAWTKRMHPGWAAQSGLRAVELARHGFLGPLTVFEGTHGLLHGFANSNSGDWDALLGDFSARSVTETVAFKPYACGTMTHPYVDCAKRLAARGIRADDIVEITCEVAEGTVHRLWEPLEVKRRPPNRRMPMPRNSASPSASPRDSFSAMRGSTPSRPSARWTRACARSRRRSDTRWIRRIPIPGNTPVMSPRGALTAASSRNARTSCAAACMSH